MKAKGSILIVVLWALFILSALSIAVSGYVRAEISVAGKLSQNCRTYYLARAGIERAITGLINAEEKEYAALSDSWSSDDASFKDVVFGDGRYSIVGLYDPAADPSKLKYGLSDEERKINVNTAPLAVLKNLFKGAAGLGEEDAFAIAASVINWRSPADKALKEGAGAFYYQTIDRPYKCKNAAIEVIEELLLIRGITKDIFDKIKSHVTLYGSGAVNINTADRVSLISLGISEELADKVISFLANNVFEDTSKITTLLTEKDSISAEDSGKINSLIASGLLSVNSENFGGIAIGSMISAPLSGGTKIAFVFDRKNRALRYWRE